jgi:HEPN domain-containing protein
MTDLLKPFKQPGKGLNLYGPQAKGAARWIRWGDADYLAARLLFLIDLITQATALSTTAIEKYLKAVCCFYGIKVPKGSKGHDVEHIYSSIKASSKTNTLALNEDYLRLLTKAYRVRYPDDLEDGFCIALNRAKMLSQLDRSVLEITRRFHDVPSDPSFPMALETAVQKADKRYLDENVAMDPTKAADLFTKPSWCVELRKYSDEVMESVYRVTHIDDDLVFPDCVIAAEKSKETNWETVFKPLADVPVQHR